MSQMWRDLAIRICFYLGVYKEKMDKLAEENIILKEQVKLLESTGSLYIDYCRYNGDGCDFWFIDGDDADLIDKNNIHSLDSNCIRWCEECSDHACKPCANKHNWIRIQLDSGTDGIVRLCNKCFDVFKESDDPIFTNMKVVKYD